MFTKSRIFGSLLSLSLAGILAACGGSGTEPGPEEAAAPSQETGEQVEIRFTWWGDTERHDRYNAITDLFEAANPDVLVIREPASWGDYWTRLSTQTAGGNAPTLFGMHPQFVSDYALRGALADLEPFINDGTIDTSEIETPVLESGRVGDNLYMVSQGVTFQGFLANRTLLDRFGIPAPQSTEDWTWDEFVQHGLAFADAAAEAGENRYFSMDQSGGWISFRWFQRQFGGDIFTEDGGLGVDEGRLVKWFEMWNELRDHEAIPDPATVTEDAQRPLEQRLLTLGEIAMQVFPANQLPLYQAQSDDQFTMLRIPVDANQTQRAEFIEGAYFAIASTASAAEQEAAARLINFFVNYEEALDIFLLEQGVPANTRLSQHILGALTEQQGEVVGFVNAIMPIADTAVYPPLGAGEIDSLFAQVAERVQHGLLTPEAAAAQFMQEATAILERN